MTTAVHLESLSYVLHTAGNLHTQIRLCMQAACLRTFALKTDTGMLFPMIYTTTVFCISIFNNSAFNFGLQASTFKKWGEAWIPSLYVCSHFLFLHMDTVARAGKSYHQLAFTNKTSWGKIL